MGIMQFQAQTVLYLRPIPYDATGLRTKHRLYSKDLAKPVHFLPVEAFAIQHAIQSIQANFYLFHYEHCCLIDEP
jgi:hypothetical protein